MEIKEQKMYTMTIDTDHGAISFKKPAPSQEDFVKQVKAQLVEALANVNMNYPEKL